MMLAQPWRWWHHGIGNEGNHFLLAAVQSQGSALCLVRLRARQFSSVELVGKGCRRISKQAERGLKVDAGTSSAESGELSEKVVKGAALGARARRLERVRHEKVLREKQKKETYPEWALILEKNCKGDPELKEILGDTIGNPEAMQKRLQERVLRKGRNVLQSRSGSAVPVIVSFRDFDPFDSYIWLELYAAPSDKETDTLGRVIQAWYILGQLGAFNSMSLQLTNLPLNERPSYSAERAAEALPAFFHDIGNLEFQDNWARLWVDLGTSDPLALDVMINSLTAISSRHVGIKQLIFGGKNFGDWEEGMTNPEDGYKVYKM